MSNINHKKKIRGSVDMLMNGKDGRTANMTVGEGQIHNTTSQAGAATRGRSWREVRKVGGKKIEDHTD